MHSLNHGGNGAVQYLRELLASIDLAFCKLQRIQFSAPWDAGRDGC